MLPVFDLLEIFFQFHLGGKQTVLVHILFVFYLIVVRDLCKVLFVLPLQFLDLFAVVFFRQGSLPLAACSDRLKIRFIKLRFQECFRLGDKAVDRSLIFCLDRSCLFQFRLVFFNPSLFLCFCVNVISLYTVDLTLDGEDFVCTVFPEIVDLFLDRSHTLVDRRAQLHLLFSCKDLVIHIRFASL